MGRDADALKLAGKIVRYGEAEHESETETPSSGGNADVTEHGCMSTFCPEGESQGQRNKWVRWPVRDARTAVEAALAPVTSGKTGRGEHKHVHPLSPFPARKLSRHMSFACDSAEVTDGDAVAEVRRMMRQNLKTASSPVTGGRRENQHHQHPLSPFPRRKLSSQMSSPFDSAAATDREAVPEVRRRMRRGLKNGGGSNGAADGRPASRSPPGETETTTTPSDFSLDTPYDVQSA